jgi:tripartite-type tricarboxylate transporter receptor subunit TctC
MAEAGFPGVEVGSGVGLVAPAGTPPDVIDALHRASADIIATPGYKERMTAIGVDTVGTTTQEYARIIREEYAKWGKVVAVAGIKPD